MNVDLERRDWWMAQAIHIARACLRSGERPFGAVVVHDLNDSRPVGMAGGSGTWNNPTRHCELIAINEACHTMGGKLVECTLFTTHQPCPMCAGAIAHSKLKHVVYGSARQDLPRYFTPKQINAEDILAETLRPPTITRLRVQECISLWDGIQPTKPVRTAS